MKHSELEQKLARQWDSEATTTRESLERDDQRQIRSFRTFENVQNKVIREPNLIQARLVQEFGMCELSLAHLREFTDGLTYTIGLMLDDAVLWGTLGLLLTLSAQEEDALARIARMLKSIGHKLEMFNNHGRSFGDEGSRGAPAIKESCFDVHVSLLAFLAGTVKLFRAGLPHTTYASDDSSGWQPLTDLFAQTTSDIDDALLRVERHAQLASQASKLDDISKLQSLLSLSNNLPSESKRLPQERARLPCIMLPQLKTSKFFDRFDIIHKIKAHFDNPQAQQTFCSLALYGLGGVGKSSVAQRFAQAQIQEDRLDALFWVHGEKELSIKQSFTDIAMQLRLPEATPQNHEENRGLVLNWLQQTTCRWLLVYDNVETIEILQPYWPYATQGRALLTTRNRSLSWEPAEGGIEIDSWTGEEGRQFLLHLLAGYISNDLTQGDIQSAQELSERLSGHALAISQMAGLIHHRRLKIDELLRMYKQNTREIHKRGAAGQPAIDTVWKLAFQELEPKSSAFLGVLSFVSPDRIPQTLFEPGDADLLPSRLKFCSNEFSLSERGEELYSQALITRDEDTKTFSIHRLVQTSFKYFMSENERQQVFLDTAQLLYHALPQRDTSLYSERETLEKYVQHALYLKDCFKEEHQCSKGFKASREFCELLATCQRYLLDEYAFAELADTIDVNTIAAQTLNQEDQVNDLMAKLPSHKGQMLDLLGQPGKGLKENVRSYEIRLGTVPHDDFNLSWAESNVGESYHTSGDYETAMVWYNRARVRWQAWQKSDGTPDDYPSLMSSNLGLCLVRLKNFELARHHFNEALKLVQATMPLDYVQIAQSQFGLGVLSQAEGFHETAEAHFMEAQNSLQKGGQARTHLLNGGCMYKLGCCTLDQGKVEAGIKHFGDAREITGLYQRIMAGEHARCLFKLSEALQQEPGAELDANVLRNEAEVLLRKRAGPDIKAAYESSYDAQVYFLWR